MYVGQEWHKVQVRFTKLEVDKLLNALSEARAFMGPSTMPCGESLETETVDTKGGGG